MYLIIRIPAKECAQPSSQCAPLASSPFHISHFRDVTPTLWSCERRAFPLIQKFQVPDALLKNKYMLYTYTYIHICTYLFYTYIYIHVCSCECKIAIPSAGQIGAKAKATTACKSQKRRSCQIEETSCWLLVRRVTLASRSLLTHIHM